jgi:hypothetical protein
MWCVDCAERLAGVALTEFRSDAFYETVRAVQAVADARILKLPADVSVVLTETLTQAKGAAIRRQQRRIFPPNHL